MKALVTGGAGFLGSCLVDRLLAAGLSVDALDDLSQGHMDNLQHALKNDRFRFHLGTVLDHRLVDTLAAQSDVVFHLAALVGMRTLLEAGGKTLKVNAGGSYEVLRACVRHTKRCVLFSSSDVYGNGNGAPFHENQPLEPGLKGSTRWKYAVAKICAEKAALYFFRRWELPVTVVRPFNATGFRQSAASGMVVPNFVRNALRGEALRVYGSGEQSRTFIAEEDLLDQVIGLAMDDRSIGRIVNVGGKEEFSVNELARMVKDVLKSASPILKLSYEEAYESGYIDVERRRPDLGRLESLGHCRAFKPIRDVVAEMASALSGKI